jgi:hypothetical protein
MLYLLVPIGLVIAFVIYVLYLAIIKKNLRTQVKPVILPGLFFISVWAVIYFLLLK